VHVPTVTHPIHISIISLSTRAHFWLTTRVLLLRDDHGTVMLDFGDGEAHVHVLALLHQVLEHGVVAASDVGGAFDQMACHQSCRKLVKLVALPVMPPSTIISISRKTRQHWDLRCSTNDWSSISYTASNHDIGALSQRL
jgi:hypothetical protein